MTRLLRAEIARLLSRRLVHALAAGLAVLVVVAPLAADPVFRARARVERDADVERCVRDTVATVAECESSVPPADGRFTDDDVVTVVRWAGLLLVLAAFVLGASAIGADWQAGVVATALTWEPRRVRTALARLAAVVSVVGAAALAWQAALALVLAGSVPGEVVRTTVLAVVAAVAGHGLGLGTRSTAGALVAVLVWVVAVEQPAGTAVGSAQRWLATDNALDLTRTGSVRAGVVLAAYASLVAAAATVAFARRDV